MAVIETTFNNFTDASVSASFNSVPTFMRTVIANLYAATVEDWILMFNTSVSLSYNNEYVLIDYVKQ